MSFIAHDENVSDPSLERSRLASIVEDSEDAIISKDLMGRVTSWNRSAETMFGYSADEMIGRPILILFPDRFKAEETLILERLRRGERIEHYETVRVRKDGREIDVSVTVSPIRDPDDQVVGASKIVRDITESNRLRAELDTLQRELLHVSRLNDMGQMAAAFAHELKQPLTAMRNYLGGLQRALQAGDGDRAIDACERSLAQLDRTAHVVARLRTFVERRESDQKLQPLEPAIEEAASLALLSTVGPCPSLSIRMADEAREAIIDRVQIQQVLVNLLRNAVEATAEAPVRDLAVRTRRKSAGWIEVEVTDSGPGLPPEVLARLFQPFTTTKTNGMGVGLSLCRTIVENHGGEIQAGNSPRGGAWFRFTVPTQA